MTISILAFDEKTGRVGGAAATGSLCVGGWVLRGDAESGLSASQGSLPSTLWGTAVLDRMRSGATALSAVTDVVALDAGRGQRQLAALDLGGGTAAFTGEESIAASGSREGKHVVVAGNLLQSDQVLDACLEAYTGGVEALDLRLLSALDAAAASGGDSRGFLSAALLVVARDHAPLTLRIDKSEQPLTDLRSLHEAATTGTYAQWSALVPTLDAPQLAVPYKEKADQPV